MLLFLLHVHVLILADIAQMFNLIAELVIPTGIPITEAKQKLKNIQ